MLFLRANRESRVTATASISPLRTARSRANRPGRQKESALSTFAALAYDTVPVAGWPIHGVLPAAARQQQRCPLPVRAYNQTRGKNSSILFLVLHFTPPNRNSEAAIQCRAARLDPTALDAECVDTVLQQRCKQPLQFRAATMYRWLASTTIRTSASPSAAACGAESMYMPGTQRQRLFFCAGLGDTAPVRKASAAYEALYGRSESAAAW